MIIKGNPAGSVGFWSKHLLRDDTNTLAEVREISGLSATDLPSALREMQAVASGSRSKGNFMYQANINPLAHEHLTPQQWTEAVNTLERNLGLQGHQRVVIEHVKEGRQHYHIVWNRVDVETMKVADMKGNWITHTKTARELEARFGLEPTPTRAPVDRKPSEQLWEKRAAERSGITIQKVKSDMSALWAISDNGQAFKAAIEQRGYILAKGDRRDFCVVDRAGDPHSLAKRLDGVNTAQMRLKMGDVDREKLPTVKVAREQQRSKFPSRTSGKKVEVGHHHSKPVDTPHTLNYARTAHGPLLVANRVTGGVEKLSDFVSNFLSGGNAPKRDPNAARAERTKANLKSAAALRSIRESIEAGKTLRPEDIFSLTAEHLTGIKVRGDLYLHDAIKRMEQGRASGNERERGRERER